MTIVPRGGALGMTMWLPSDDKMHQLRSEMLDQLVVAMGGAAPNKSFLVM